MAPKPTSPDDLVDPEEPRAATKVTDPDRFKDFDAARAGSKDDPAEPLTFMLGGRVWTVIDPLPGGPLLDFIVESDQVARTIAGIKLFRVCVVPEERELLQKVLAEAVPTIGVAAIDSILAWVIAEQTGRPSKPS